MGVESSSRRAFLTAEVSTARFRFRLTGAIVGSAALLVGNVCSVEIAGTDGDAGDEAGPGVVESITGPVDRVLPETTSANNDSEANREFGCAFNVFQA